MALSGPVESPQAATATTRATAQIETQVPDLIPCTLARWSSRGKSRLLLRETVERAEAPDEITGVDSYDGTVWEAFPEDAERHAILRIVEGGDEHGGIRDVEIRVARRQARAVEIQRRGHGQIDDVDGRTVLEPHSLQPFTVLGQGSVVRVVRVVLAAQHDGARVHEAAQIVDMTVRVVPGDSQAEPQHGQDRKSTRLNSSHVEI